LNSRMRETDLTKSNFVKPNIGLCLNNIGLKLKNIGLCFIKVGLCFFNLKWSVEEAGKNIALTPLRSSQNRMIFIPLRRQFSQYRAVKKTDKIHRGRTRRSELRKPDGVCSASGFIRETGETRLTTSSR
jgi:hypothetical protein